MMNRFDTILDTDSAWARFHNEVSHSDHDDNTRFQRVNPRLDQARPALDETKKLADLQKEVQKKLSSPIYKDKFRKISYQLVANSFYFEKSPRLSKEVETTAVGDSIAVTQETVYFAHSFQGQLICRFHNCSQHVRHLGLYLRNKSTPTFEPYFLIREKYQDAASQELKITAQVIERMINLAEFDMDLVRIPVSGKLAVTTIALCLTRNNHEAFQISGFPRDLLVEDVLIGTPASARLRTIQPLEVAHADISFLQPQQHLPRSNLRSVRSQDSGVRDKNVGMPATHPQLRSGIRWRT